MEDQEKTPMFIVQLKNLNGDIVFISGPVEEATVKDLMNLRRDSEMLGCQRNGVQINRNDGAMTYLSANVVDNMILTYFIASDEE